MADSALTMQSIELGNICLVIDVLIKVQYDARGSI
jgi:hypothetical protein